MNMYHLTSAKRKKYQRRMNQIVRHANKAIKNDWLWNGRFTLRQVDAVFEPFDDHSGAMFTVLLELTDHKTGKIEQKIFDNYDIDYAMPWWVNNCITESFKVWDEDPNPHQQALKAGRRPPEYF